MDIFASDLRPMEYWHMKASDKLEKWAGGVPEGYSTGFGSIDWYTRLVDTELTILAARPSQGKTSLGR